MCLVTLRASFKLFTHELVWASLDLQVNDYKSVVEARETVKIRLTLLTALYTPLPIYCACRQFFSKHDIQDTNRDGASTLRPEMVLWQTSPRLVIRSLCLFREIQCLLPALRICPIMGLLLYLNGTRILHDKDCVFRPRLLATQCLELEW